MPIVIDQMEVQPAAATPSRGSNAAESASGAAPAASEDQKQRDVIRSVRFQHDRRARLRAY